MDGAPDDLHFQGGVKDCPMQDISAAVRGAALTLVAFVVLQPGQHLEPERIREHCRARLARYKVPRDVRIVPALPRSPQGKILKRELHRLYVGSGGQPPSKVA